MVIEANERYLPHPLLFGDPTRAQNSLGSFLANDLSEKLPNVIGEEKARLFHRADLKQLAIEAIHNLQNNNSAISSWIDLLGILPLYTNIESEFESIICGTDFVELVNKDIKLGTMAIRITSLQAPTIRNPKVTTHLRDQVIKIVKLLTERYPINAISKLSEEEQNELKNASGMLLEVVLNIAKVRDTPEKRAAEFKEICLKMVKTWSYLISIVKPIVQLFCEVLPPHQAKHMWSLLLFLRATQ